MGQCNLHIKILLGWFLIILLIPPVLAQPKETTDSIRLLKIEIPLLKLVAYEDTLKQTIKIPGALEEINSNVLQDSLFSLESAINERMQKLHISDSLLSKLSKPETQQILSQDSTLSAMIQKYNEYLKKYDLPEKNLPEWAKNKEKIINVPEIQAPQLAGTPDIPAPQIPNLPDAEMPDNINKLSEKQEEVNSHLGKQQNIDETIGQHAHNIEEVQYFDAQKAELLALSEKMGEPDLMKLKRQISAKQKALATQTIMSNLDKINIPTKTIKKLQNKYQQFNSANAIADGREKGLKFKPEQRFVYGLNLQMNPGDPVSVDFSPLLGYRINNAWTPGTGGSIRYKLDSKDDYRLPNSTNMVYGYRIFSQYKVIKSYYIHTELEAFNRPISVVREWNYQALAGIGKEFSITKNLKGNISILYNFLHDEKSPYPKPFMFRVGVVRKK